MKQFYLLCVCGLLMQIVHGQKFSLSTLIDYTAIPFTKFESTISKKGFRKTDEQSKNDTVLKKYQWFKKGEIKYPNDCIAFGTKNDKDNFISFETTDLKQVAELIDDLKENFHYPANDSKYPTLYQRENIRVWVNTIKSDSLTKYQFSFDQTLLPKQKDLVFAEDLLKVTSHEYLTTIFGNYNVLKDVFYFSEKELNRCSILFPNTNREVVFVWKDEVNYSGISFIIIGGHIQTQTTMHNDNQVEQNVWRSNQGVYTGMSLSELQDLNGSAFNFYGWHLDFAGAIMPHTKGKINFDRIGCILNCLNCSGSNDYENKIVSSEKALADDRKIFVTTMIILPEKTINSDKAMKKM